MTVADEVKAGEAIAEDGHKLSDAELVARRTIDAEAEATQTHEKVFVLGNLPGDAKLTERNYDHEPNKVATRQYAVQNGLRPTAPVKVKSIKQHRNGRSWVVTYSVPVVPVERGLDASGPDFVGDQHAAAHLADAVADDDERATE